MTTNRLPRIICAWGSHRSARDVTALAPSNADKGVRELQARGYDTRHVYPWPHRWRPRSNAARRARYLAAIPNLLAACANRNSVIYTADLPWLRIIAALKRAGMLNRRVVAHWGGIDFEPGLLRSSPGYLRAFERLFASIDAVWLASENERRIWAEALPHLADRFAFRPMFIDLTYYGSLKPARQGIDILAIGSDARRDWDLPLALAARGLQVAIATEDARVRQRVETLPPPVARNVRLLFRSGFRRSAEAAASAACLLVATRPNFRFSGSTTLAMAAALGRPLLIDEPYDLPAYGLTPGVHCQTFERGDVDSAYAGARRLIDNPAQGAAMGAALRLLGPSMDIEAFVDALEESFLPGWRRPAARAAAASPSIRPEIVPRPAS